MNDQTQGAAPAASGGGGSITLVIVAVVMGLITVIMTNVYINAVKRDIEGQSFTVYRLRRNVEPGYVLREKDLEPVSLHEKFREGYANAVTPKSLDNQLGQKIQRVAYEGELLTYGLFTSESELLDHKISENKRGCPLPLSSRTAPGILRPGMFIDLKATFQQPGQLPQTMTVLERVKVVAVGQVTEETATGRRSNYNNITVEVEPDVAEALLTISKFLGREGFDILIRNPRETYTQFVKINPRVLRQVGIEE